MVAVKKQKIMTLAYLVVAVVAIVGYVLYIPIYGAWAAAWVTLLSESLIGLFAFIVVSMTTKRLPNLKMTARAVVSTIAMAGVIGFFTSRYDATANPALAAFIVVTGIIVYAAAISVLGGPRPQMIAKLFLPEKPTGSV